MKPIFTVWVRVAILTAFASSLPITARPASPSEADAGRALYIQKGCFECHGHLGQGSIMSGPALVPGTIGLAAIQSYVRAPKGQMPVYSAKILSHEELNSIRVYLTSIPNSRLSESIPLLTANADSKSQIAQANPDTPSRAPRGAEVFSAHCASCHGAGGEGGMGPSLLGAGSRRGVTGVAAFIRVPSGAMPALFPSTMNARDVDDVARYVTSLH